MNKTGFIFALSLFAIQAFGQIMPCQVVQIAPNPVGPVFYSPDSSKYFISKQDTAGKFQIYVGLAGDTNTVCISNTYTTGNCCGLFRHWETRNKLAPQWHASGDYIICGVEKEYYNELLFVPYNLLLGWLQSGIWLDIWAVTPDGSHWYNLANTEGGFTGPAFTPDGTRCAYAEKQNGGNIAVDVFGVWKMKLVDFAINAGTPAFANATDISPAGSRWLEPGDFAPDGVSLLFNSDIGMVNAEGQDQYILDISSGDVTNLTNSPMIWDEHGVFSPDGNKILFMSSYPYRADTNSYHTLSIKTEFMLMNADGSDLKQLTHFRDTGYVESSAGIAATGFWTFDGTRIYAQSLVFPDYENWIIDFEGNCGNAALTTDIYEITDSGIRIYPNPATEILTIECSDPQNQNTDIQIFTATGVLLREVSIEQSVQINLADLPKGLYFVGLKNWPWRLQKFIRQ